MLAGLVFSVHASLGAPASPRPSIVLDAESAQPVALRFAGREISFPQRSGGFAVQAITKRQAVPLKGGTVTRGAEGISFTAASPAVKLRATFAPHDDRLRVEGELENLEKDEQGFILEYRIPLLGPEAVVGNALDHAVRPAGSPVYEGNVFPIGAMETRDAGVAVAIPPADPRIFGIGADKDGMVIRFYLGTSPATRRFPNRASFAFILYGVRPGGGFRHALSRYYAFFPDYYAPRLKTDGLWMFQMEDRLPPNIDQYGFNEIGLQQKAVFEAALKRDQQHGIATFPYIMVGQRELKFLPALPRNYAEAAAILERWSPDDGVGTRRTSEQAAADVHLREEMESSGCRFSDGRYVMVVRNTPWGADSITFKTNPNPELFSDRSIRTVGGSMLALTEEWTKQYPAIAGIYVDSLGAGWPATLNYRTDHFAYARYPLTFDPQGKVALQNDLSHYEFLDALRTQLRRTGRLLFGNGVYSYKSRTGTTRRVGEQKFDKEINEFNEAMGAPEHYRAGTQLGRFFDAALLDLAGSEAGIRANLQRCQDVRTFMGRKHYAFLNYNWDDAARVEELLNKSLCFAIFATSTKNFMTREPYEDHPNGYHRDKALIDWFVPLVRLLSRAGWEPDRRATLDVPELCCERFGQGDTIYYALYNDTTAPRSCTLDIDLAALGFSPEARIEEIARQTVLARKDNRVTFDLAPKRACIIKVSGRTTRQ